MKICTTLLLFLFYTLPMTYAVDAPMCLDSSQNQGPTLDQEIGDLAEAVENAATNYYNIGRHPEIGRNSCNVRLSTAQVESRIMNRASRDTNTNANGHLISLKSHGVNFENEHPSLIMLFNNLMSTEQTTSRRLTRRRSTGRNYTMNTSCKKVLCAVKQQFGNSVGPKLLYMLQEYGFNGSYLSYDQASNWRPSELDELLVALEDLPKGLLPLGRIRSFTRMKRGCVDPERYNSTGGCIMAVSTMRFFDCLWNNNYNNAMRRSTTLHEIGHLMSYEFSSSQLSDWKNLSGWRERSYYKETRVPVNPAPARPVVRRSGGCYRPIPNPAPAQPATGPFRTVRTRVREYVHSDNACFISSYGSTSYGEDFAESFATYRYAPDLLKRECPSKYNFIRDKVMNGIEFTNRANFCQRRPRYVKENSFLSFLRDLWPY